MKAVGLLKYLDIEKEESLIDLELDMPIPEDNDLLVKVKAISVNPVDVKVRAPKDEVEEQPKILGWDVSGIVEQVGKSCTLFKPGDEVYYAGSIIRQGANSEYHVVDERIVGQKPKTLDFAEAAALPLTSITAWEGLFERLEVPHNKEENKNKKILIIGGAGGVGSIAVQLSKLAGLEVIATASRVESTNWVKKMGADYVIDHHQQLLKQLEDLNIHNVDYIFCLNNLDYYWQGISEVIKPQGKICSIVENENLLDLDMLKSKSITFIWEFMFTRSMYNTSDIIKQHELLTEIAQYIDNKKLGTTITHKLAPINAANLKKAHKMIESGGMIGKVVLESF